MLRLLRQVSLRQLRASWGRTILVVGGVATGVALIVAIDIINTSVLANFRRTIEIIAGPAQLEVTLGVGELGFPESVVDLVKKDAGVAAVVPLVRGTVSVGEGGETLELFGADLIDESDLERYRIRLRADREDMVTWLADAHSIAVTAVFAERHGLEVRDTFELGTPGGIEEVTVRGLLEAEGIARALGGQLAIMDLPAAQLLLARGNNIDQVDVVLRPDADVDAVRRRLEATLPSTLTVSRPVQRSAQYEAILGSFQAMLTGLSLLCLVAGVYIVYNTTSTAALHRSFVMAGLRLIGAEPARLFRLLMLEAFVLGVIGTAIGIPTGALLARGLIYLVSESMGVIFQMRFPTEDLVPDMSRLLLIALVGPSAAVFASWFPARRVAALEPLQVLKADLRSLTAEPRSGRLVLWWIALVLISAVALVLEVRFKSVAWGNFGSTLWFASSIVIAIPLVSAVSRVLRRVLSWMAGAEGRVAAESLTHSLTRTGVTVAAVTLVLTVAVTFASLTVSFRHSVSSYYKEGGLLLGDLVVSAVATEGGWLETPLPEGIAADLRALPGVSSVEVARAIPGQMYRDQRLTLVGLSDGFLDPDRYGPRWYLHGDHRRAADALRAGEGVNVSGALADRFDLRVGDAIILDTPTKPFRMPIVGVVRDYMSDRGTVIMNRRLLIQYWTDTAVNRFNVYLDGPTTADRVEGVREAIKDTVGRRYRLKVHSPPEVLAYHVDAINRAFAFTDAIQLLIIVVTIAGIFDLLLATIIERRRELAVWRVIGADEHTVRRSVVLESATIGILGAALGCVVGLITAWTWIGINFRYLLGYHLEYRFAIGSMVWYVALVLAMTVIAGYAAARKATAESILQGIQTE